MWEIVTIGDAGFLQQVLNGLAMMTNVGTFQSLAALGATIGVLIVTMRGITRQTLELHTILIGWILVMGFLVPKTDVQLEDAYNGNTVIIANVPLGVAVTASLMSSVGVTLTDLFETGFTTPSMLNNGGFVDPLKTLLNLRQPGLGNANNLGDTNVDIGRTITAYVNDCTLYAIDLGFKSNEELFVASNLLAAIEAPSDIWGTRTWLPGDGPNGVLRTCNEAYPLIRAHLDGTTPGFEAAWDNHIRALLGKPGDVVARIDDALNFIMPSVKDARTFMLNNLLWEMINNAKVDQAISSGDVAGAMIITQAAEQRNVEMAAEGTLFKRFARPLLTFIESLTYAVTPLIAFLLMTGPYGISLVGQYLKFAASVQLWGPVAALINAYTTWVVTNKLSMLEATGNIDPTTIRGMNSMYPYISDWLGTAGMLLTATPAITIMLVYGGVHAATHFAQRMNARDTVDEKMAAPSYAQVGPALSAAPQAMHSYGKGTRLADTEGWHGGLNTNAIQTAAETSTRQRISTLSSGLQNDVSNTVSGSAFMRDTFSNGQSFRTTDELSKGNFGRFTSKTAADLLGSTTNDNEARRAVQDTLSGSIGLGREGGGGKGKSKGLLELRKRLDNISTLTTAQKDAIQQRVEKAIAEDSGFQRQATQLLARDISEGNETAFGNAYSDEARASLQKTLNKLDQIQEADANIQQGLQLIGSQYSGDFNAIGTHLSQKASQRVQGTEERPKAELWNWAQANATQGVRQDMNEQLDRLQKTGFKDDPVGAHEAAALHAITQNFLHDPVSNWDSMNEGMQYLADATGHKFTMSEPRKVVTENPELKNEVSKGVEPANNLTQPGKTGGEINAAVDNARSDFSDTQNNWPRFQQQFEQMSADQQQAFLVQAIEEHSQSRQQAIEPHLQDMASNGSTWYKGLQKELGGYMDTVSDFGSGVAGFFRGIPEGSPLSSASSASNQSRIDRINENKDYGMESLGLSPRYAEFRALAIEMNAMNFNRYLETQDSYEDIPEEVQAVLRNGNDTSARIVGQSQDQFLHSAFGTPSKK